MENNKPLKNKMSFASLILLSIWIISPVVIMILNATQNSTEETYKIWISFLFVTGGLSFIPGLRYLQEIASNTRLKTRDIIISSLPLIIFSVFMLWNILSTLLSDFPLIATFGKVPLSDCLFEYFAFGGMIISGITIAYNKKHCFILANIFISMATILAIIALINNDFTALLCVNEKTNTFEYQSVFFNTNHYGYYLTIATIICAYLIEYMQKPLAKFIYIIPFATLIITLIKNDTMGAYLAVILTLIFGVVWAFINNEDKKQPIFVLSIFLLVSIAMQIAGENIFGNFTSMFTDMFTISDSESSIEEIQSTGSGRLLLWQASLIFIKIHPILGWGLSNIGLSAHNMFLQIAIYSGVVGLTIYLSAFVVGAIRLIKSRKVINPLVKACSFAVVAYLISGFFGLTVFYTAPYFYIVLGICMSGCLGKLVDEK